MDKIDKYLNEAEEVNKKFGMHYEKAINNFYSAQDYAPDELYSDFKKISKQIDMLSIKIHKGGYV